MHFESLMSNTPRLDWSLSLSVSLHTTDEAETLEGLARTTVSQSNSPRQKF